MPRYLRRKGAEPHEIFLYTEGLNARGDMEEVTENEAQAILGGTPEKVEMTPEERSDKIKAAISDIPKDQWGNGPGGSFPKVGDVSEKAGFKVTLVEIKEIVSEKAPESETGTDTP